MTNFKEQDGMLFKMLEEPVPLTPDAEMPCLVRLIQDDSPMGRYNRDAAYFDVIGKLFVAQKIKENPFYSNTLHAYEKNSLNQDSCIASIHQLEIIGYPVVEGSHWWALYSAMNGKSFVHKDAKQCRIFTMFSERELRVSDGEGETVEYVETDEFLNDAAKDGWQLYKEPKPEPKPKPLLADSRVGDLCKTDLDEWIQIDDAPEPPSPILYHYNRPFKGNIIHTEPLAPEGSAEWAWQMLMLGKTVYNPAYYYTPSHGLITPNMLGNRSKQSFVDWQEPSGWQLYEPKPEPAREQFEVGDWVEYGLDGDTYYGKICNIRGYVYYLSVTTEEVPKDQERAIMLESIIRKLFPSQWITNLGNATLDMIAIAIYEQVLNNAED